jgi:hypothetical protein
MIDEPTDQQTQAEVHQQVCDLIEIATTRPLTLDEQALLAWATGIQRKQVKA